MFGYIIKFDHSEMIEYNGLGRPLTASAISAINNLNSYRSNEASPDSNNFNFKYDKLIKAHKPQTLNEYNFLNDIQERCSKVNSKYVKLPKHKTKCVVKSYGLNFSAVGV